MKRQKMELSGLLSTMGSRIRKMRLKQGMTQEQLAEALYSKKVTISAYENDRIDIKSSVVIELARILECSVSYLMEEEIIVEDCEELLHIYKRLQNDEVRKIAVDQLKVLAKHKI